MGFDCDELLANCELTPERTVDFLHFNYLSHSPSPEVAPSVEAIEVSLTTVIFIGYSLIYDCIRESHFTSPTPTSSSEGGTEGLRIPHLADSST